MPKDEKRCPECGEGTLVDITYREGRAAGGDEVDEPIQSGETRQVETYSCGHEVVGPRLDATAGARVRREPVEIGSGRIGV